LVLVWQRASRYPYWRQKHSAVRLFRPFLTATPH
jgi:hypothetical protein